MDRSSDQKDFENLPQSVQEFIKLIIKKMGYRRSVRRDVQAELTAHFEDELRDCTDQQHRQQKSQRLIEQFGDAKLLGILLRRAKKRCRPLWRTVITRSFQAILLLFCLLVIYCIYLSLGRPTIKVDYVKKLAEISHPKADKSQNAAPLYEQSFEFYKEPPVIEIEKAGPNDSKPGTKGLLEAIEGKRIYELTQVESAALEEWIGNNSKAIDFYIQSSNKPYYWRNRESATSNMLELELPELSKIRRLSVLVSWQARLKAEQCDIDGAFEDLFAIYRVGMHFKGPRTLIEQLVGIAIRAMAVNNARQIIYDAEPDEQILSYIQNEFQSFADKDGLTISFKAESYFMMDFIQRSYTDDGKGSGRMSPAGVIPFLIGDEDVNSIIEYIPALGVSIISANRRNLENTTRDFYDFLDKRVKLTPWQSHNTPINDKYKIDSWSKIRKIRYWPIYYLMPALTKLNQISYRIKIDTEALITVVALQRYERQNGSYPQTLDALVQTKLLNEVPADPFSDSNLIYRKTESGFILYSVGLDFKDDGGVLGSNSEGQKTIWADEGDAVFWPVQK